MAVAPKRQRDPNDPVQILRSKKHGEVKCDGKFWIGGPGVGKTIILTPEGGYRYARGGPIRSRKELDIIDPGPDRERAYHWWDNKDNWQNTAPRKIGFETGTGFPIYEDTGEYVESEDALLTNWPGDSPIFWAAVKALGKRQETKVPQKDPIMTYDSVTNAQPAAPTPVPQEDPLPEQVSERKLPSLHKTRGKKLTKAQLIDRRNKIAATKAAKEKAAEQAAMPAPPSG